MSKLKLFLEVLKDTYNGFFEQKILKLSASLAYTTVFSMAPLLLVVLYLCDIFFGREAIEGVIFSQTNNFIGYSAANQLQTMIKGLNIYNESKLAGVFGIATLLIGATSVFAEIQDSINTIWGIRPNEKSGFWLYIKSRLMSFGVIGSLGFILLVSLGFSTLLDLATTKLLSEYSNIGVYIIYSANIIITSLVITLLFGSIFAILPDVKISWKQVRVASFTTALLFMLGKFLISFYISKSNISSMYGTAGSFVILMVWVYYSSVILYFGAEFSKCYAVKFASPIKPLEFAEIVQKVEITSSKETIQKADKEIKVIKKADKIEIKTITNNEEKK
ncbi:YihY/virulence factor BrkB family protein [Flavobacterium sp.]|uniref:YihY/virulence factor BrkB family protein n=1 Tax=Flavobacterium sp. TaxID=239 RepID=UPI00375012DF